MAALRGFATLALLVAATDVPLPDLSTAQPQVRDKIVDHHAQVLDTPDAGDAWGRYSMVLHAHRCIAEADVAYSEAERLAPDEFRWPYYHAILLQRTDPVRSLQLLESSLERDRSYAPAVVRRGILLETMGRFDEAWEAYGQALNLDPRYPAALFHRGVAALERGNSDLAVRMLERANERRPNNAAVLSVLARAYQRSGDRERARETAALARQMPKQLLFEDPMFAELSDEAVNLRAYIQRAEALEQVGRLDEALDEINRAIEHDPDHILLYVALTDVYIRQKEYEEAVDAARTVVASDLDIQNVHKSLAISLFELGRLDEAEAEALLALQENPIDGDVHQVLGRTYSRTDRPDEAIDYLTRSLEFKPNDNAALFLLGRLLLGQERPGEAAVRLSELTTASPDDVEAWSLLGVALLRSDRTDAAIDSLRTAHALAPGNPIVIRRLSGALGAAGRHRDQLSLLNLAHRQLPEAWPIANDLAWLLATCPTASVRDGERAVTLSSRLVRDPGSKSPATLDTLAAAFAQVGFFEEAVATMEEAIAMAEEAGLSADRLAGYVERRTLYESGRPYRPQ